MLFDSIVYGPIHSRRLGVSLGMNLMPTTAKLCSFDCVYCECGFNQPVSHPQLPSREEVRLQLETKLKAMVDGAVLPFRQSVGADQFHPTIPLRCGGSAYAGG